MIRVEHPLIILLVLTLLVAGFVVYPFTQTEQFRLRASKVAALLIAVGICIYSGTFGFLLVFLWPLSLIWFPEYWGNFTGFIQGPYIDEKSPPILVSSMGWFFLVIFPLLFLWITSR